MIDFSNLGDLNLPNEKARLLAKEIRERWPALRLVRLEPSHPEFDIRRPYALIDTEPRQLHPVLRLYPESMLDQRLLGELIDQDVRNYGGMTPNRYWALEQAERALKERGRREEAAEKNDIIVAMMGSHKHTFQYHDGDSGDTIVIRK